MAKSPPAMQEPQEMCVQFLGVKDPWIRKWPLITVFLPGRCNGWSSPVGYSLWGHKSQILLSEQTKANVFHFLE